VSNPAAAGALLGEVRATLNTALQDLRELSRGLHPSGLAEHGLIAAFEELIWATPLPVALRCDVEGRLAESVESTAYYVAAETLTNVAKHAEATRVCLDVHHRDAALVVIVTDDGRGGADPTAGTGLAGLADRVHALGGTLNVVSPAGRGTTLTARLPCAS
jgi:signal transduction histidine kinase